MCLIPDQPAIVLDFSCPYLVFVETVCRHGRPTRWAWSDVEPEWGLKTSPVDPYEPITGDEVPEEVKEAVYLYLCEKGEVE
jgi:hypothetical protein